MIRKVGELEVDEVVPLKEAVKREAARRRLISASRPERQGGRSRDTPGGGYLGYEVFVA